MSGATLGPLLDTAATSANPIAAAPSLPSWNAVANAIVTAIQASTIVSAFVCPSTGGPLTGTGTISGMNPGTLGTTLSTAFMTGATGNVASIVPVANDIAAAICTYIQASALVPAGTLVAPVGNPTAGGPITGASTVTGLVGSALGDAIDAKITPYSALGATVSLAAWEAIGTQIASHVMGSAVVAPGTLIAPAGGGPVTGAGVVS